MLVVCVSVCDSVYRCGHIKTRNIFYTSTQTRILGQGFASLPDSMCLYHKSNDTINYRFITRPHSLI